VPCNPSRRPWRARPPAGFGRAAALVTLGLTAAACTTAARPTHHSLPPVLGQQHGSPDVTGQPAPAGTGQLDSVSCAGPLHCWAVGTSGTATTGSSTTGSSTTTTTTTAPPPATVTVVDATSDGGRSWTAEPLSLPGTPALTGISCPSVESCMAVGLSGSAQSGLVLTSRRGGADWEEASNPAGAIVVTAVDCTSVSDCTAISSDGTTYWSALSTDFGRTWQRGGNLPAGLQGAAGLSCVPGGPCLVTGFTATTGGHGQGAVVISVDGGTTWTAADVPTGTGLLQSVSCASPTSCLAVGTTSTTVSAVVPAKGAVLTSDDGGHTWISSLRTTSVNDIFGVDCPSAVICAMVGTRWVGHPAVGTGAVAQSRDGGTSFMASTTAYTPLPLTALACPTARDCVAVGGDTVARIVLPLPHTRSGRTHSSTSRSTRPRGAHHAPGR
jgi:photosystem II stability/assembly factor-like uncharacterized protein